MKPTTTVKLTRMAMLAAVYTAITLFLAPISFGPFQIRIAEAMTVLPFLFPEAVWGLAIGCFLSNAIGTLLGQSFGLPDIVFGTLATLHAAYLTSKTKKVWLAPLPPVVINAIVIGAVLTYMLAPESGIAGFLMFGGQVALGQTLACYCVGVPMLLFIRKRLTAGH